MTTPDTPPAPLIMTLFGLLQVLVDGQPLPHLRSRKGLWLLALLTLRHDRPVTREWLAATLWPDTDQSQAFANLRPLLSDLRSKLGSQRERLQSPDRHTLLLDLTGVPVDLLAFDAAIQSNKLAELKQAVALYRGPLLEGCTEEWVFQERAVREKNCLQAIQTLAEAALTAGDAHTAIDYYQRAVSMDPFWDAARRGWMEALVQSGDRTAALKVYREFVELLRGDPTATPDEQMSALYTRLRTETRKPSHAEADAVVKAAPRPTVTGHLPRPLTELVGRDDERLEVRARLRRSRLVTLTGFGGIGKTRLALAVAADVLPDYPEGVWLVALEALSDGKRIASQIASVLGLREESSRTLLQSVTDHLRAKRSLLVLDNCEHLLESSAQVAAHLLRECMGLRILATSREALGITGETTWAVPALAVPDLAHLPQGQSTLLRLLPGYESVELLVERAQAVQQSFALTRSNVRAVAEVCAQLEGIPLAIELAAARTRGMTVEQIAIRLNNEPGLLTSGNRTALPRQQTLRATLDWSYALLSTAEQRLLARLSVFAGGCRLQAVEAVCSGEGIAPEQVLELLTSLVDKSLVKFEEAEPKTEGRYYLLAMVQRYAEERLQSDPAAEAVQQKHGDWFLALVEEAEPNLRGPGQETYLRQMEREYENLRRALARNAAGAGEAEYGMRLAGAIMWFWRIRGRYREGYQCLEAALGREGAQGATLARAKALSAAGSLAFAIGEYAEARPLNEESLRLYRHHGDVAGAASALNQLGNVAGYISDAATAQTLYEESLSLYRQASDTRGIAIALNNLGVLARQQMDYASTRALFEECLSLRRSLGDLQGVAQSLANLGNVVCLQGDYETARTLLEESLSLCRQIGDRTNLAYTLSYLGTTAFESGDYAVAHSRFEESLSLRRELGEKSGIAWSLLNLGRTALYTNQLLPAQQQLAESLSLFRELGHRTGIAWALNRLGEAAQRSGDKGAAWTHYVDSLRLFDKIKDKEGVTQNLQDLADILAIQAQAQSSVLLWGAAEALRSKIGAPLPLVKQAEYARQVEQVRSSLGQDAFAAFWEEGRAMTWEQATAYALEQYIEPKE